MGESNKKIAMLLAALNIFGSRTVAVKQEKIINYQVLNNNTFNLSKKEKLSILVGLSIFGTIGLITGGYFLFRNSHKDIEKLNSDQNNKALSVPKKLNSLSFKYNNISINIQNIDITKIETDEDEFKTNDRKKTAIVNAANTSIKNGAGVAAAIEKAAGEEMKKEIKSWRQKAANESKFSTNIQMGQPTYKRKNEIFDVKILKTGQSKLGTSGKMGLGGVIHTPGPCVGKSLTEEDKKLLIESYTTALQEASKAGLERIVFPSISTGEYKFPIDEAAKCAVYTITSFINNNPGTSIKSIEWAFWDPNQTVLEKMFCCYSKSIEEKIKNK
jgi:O-acetyl-ADP-ribose deacetylase (regulator of RNase III)